MEMILATWIDEIEPGSPYRSFSISDAFYWSARFPVTPKLCIDGHEYRRRQRRRTKRKRKR